MSTDVLSKSLGAILELPGANTGMVRWLSRERCLLPGLIALGSVPRTRTVDIEANACKSSPEHYTYAIAHGCIHVL